MSPPGLRDAYLLGYLPPVIGVFFNGMAIVAAAGKGATGELASRAAERERALRAQGPGVVANVRRAEALLGAAGLPVPEVPQTTEGYYRWSEQVTPSIHRSLPSHSPASVAHSLGLLLGDASLTLNLLVIVHHLLDAAPDHAYLRSQAATLLQDLDMSTVRLATTVALQEQPLPAAAVAGARKALQSLREVQPDPPPAPFPPGERARAEQTALQALSESVIEIERSLG